MLVTMNRQVDSSDSAVALSEVVVVDNYQPYGRLQHRYAAYESTSYSENNEVRFIALSKYRSHSLSHLSFIFNFIRVSA